MKNSHPSPWQDLPPPLLDLILDRLPVPDYLRFPAACTSWRIAHHDHRRRLRHAASSTSHPRQMPWLMYLDCTRSASRIVFHTPSEQRYYHLPLPPNMDTNYCCGSSHGRLLFLDYPNTPNNRSLFIVNPFAAAASSQIQLPFPPSTHPTRYFKGVLSSAPADPDCIVLLWAHPDYFFCRIHSGDTRWTKSIHPVLSPYDGYPAVTAGKFYILSGPSEEALDGTMLVVEMEPFPVCRVRCLDMDVAGLAAPRPHSDYLVESDGQILLARLTCEEDRGFIKGFIRVFRADLSQNVWVELESLGDRVLFLSFECLDSLSAAETGGPGNRIFLTEDLYDKDEYRGQLWIEYDYGSRRVMNNKLPGPHEHNQNRLKTNLLQWIVPSLC